jgi:hyperosmotically inducible protein
MKSMKLMTIALALGTLLVAKDNKPPQPVDPMTREVRHELVMIPNVTVFDDLSFKIEGNTVTLFGSVTRPIIKSSAVNVVKRIEGVDQVIDNIELLPLSTFDDRIRIATYRAIYGDPALATRYGFRALPSIRIIVKNGNIRLTGWVANEGDKNIAGIRASGVSGSFSIVNDLQLDTN